MGSSTCALFLSVKYHVLKPTYIYGRIEQVREPRRRRSLGPRRERCPPDNRDWGRGDVIGRGCDREGRDLEGRDREGRDKEGRDRYGT